MPGAGTYADYAGTLAGWLQSRAIKATWSQLSKTMRRYLLGQ